MTLQRWQKPVCACCCADLPTAFIKVNSNGSVTFRLASEREPISMEKEYYLDLCDECAEYAEFDYSSYREVLRMCMVG